VKNVLLVAPDVARVFILRDEPCPNAGGNETAERLMPPVASGQLSKTSQQSRQKKRTPGETSATAIQRNGRCIADARCRVLGADIPTHPVMSAFGGKADIASSCLDVRF
jgi:hypothetical protein